MSCFLAPTGIVVINLATYLMPADAIESRFAITNSGLVALVLFHTALKAQAREPPWPVRCSRTRHSPPLLPPRTSRGVGASWGLAWARPRVTHLTRDARCR